MKRPTTFLLLISFITIVPLLFMFYDDMTKTHGGFDRFMYGDNPPPIVHHYLFYAILIVISGVFNFALWTIPQFRDRVLSPIQNHAYQPRVMTFQNAVIKYQFPRTTSLFVAFFDDPEKQISEILTAHPNADLSKHEDALGVKIINVQKSTQTDPGIWDRDIKT
jgi:hypothetical protein